MSIIEDFNPILFFEKVSKEGISELKYTFFNDPHKHNYDIYVIDWEKECIERGMILVDDYGIQEKATELLFFKDYFSSILNQEAQQSISLINSFRLQAINKEQANYFTSQIIQRLNNCKTVILKNQHFNTLQLIFAEKVDFIIEKISNTINLPVQRLPPINSEITIPTIKKLYTFLCSINFLTEEVEDQENLFINYLLNPIKYQNFIKIKMDNRRAAFVFRLIEENLFPALKFSKIEKESIFLNSSGKPFTHLSSSLTKFSKIQNYEEIKSEIESEFISYFPKKQY